MTVFSRPFATVVLAMTMDGKIADTARSPARFGSAADKHHLEAQIAEADATLFGATTLRAYGTVLRVTQPALLQQRQAQRKSVQPIAIVCSRSGNIDPQLRFFQQPVARWLLTTVETAQQWIGSSQFDQILTTEALPTGLDFASAFQTLTNLGIERIAVLGGGELVASLLAANLVDELHLTVCPLILGGRNAPTPVEGAGFSEALAPRLELVDMRSLDQEIFLHYRVKPIARR